MANTRWIGCSERPPITYGELSAHLDLHPRSARWFLGVIQEYCDGKKLPALQALAVNKRTRLPGVGYVGSLRTKVGHEQELQKVYKHGKQWPAKAPKFGA